MKAVKLADPVRSVGSCCRFRKTARVMSLRLDRGGWPSTARRGRAPLVTPLFTAVAMFELFVDARLGPPAAPPAVGCAPR
jgi:hypothetical protein